MAKAEYTVLGTSIPRMGGVERVTGAGIFGIDLALPDALRGGVLRSQHAHAKILSIDTSEAKSLPGVYAVVTALDAPDVKYGRTTNDRYILARDRVRFMGDPVAAVAAESEADIKLNIQGKDFFPGSVVYFGASPVPTTFFNQQELRAVIPRHLLRVGTIPITVVNPRPHEFPNLGATSNGLPFMVRFSSAGQAK